MAVPALVVVFLFAYAPLPGIIIAFKNYNFRDGILGSPWNGIQNFLFYFRSLDFVRTTFNTLWINLNNTLWEMVVALSFAILLNEMRGKFFKRFFQALLFLPYFFSAVIVGKFVHLLFNLEYGIVNHVLSLFQQKAIDWYSVPRYWVGILVSADVWKYMGYSVIIYLAAIAGIDVQQFEAAGMDGAGRLRKIWHILLPNIVPTIVVVALLSVGRFLFGDFQFIWAIAGDYGLLIPTTDVIETFLYRSVFGSGYGAGGASGAGSFGILTAIGLYQSIVGLLMVVGSNALARRFSREGALF